MSDQFASLLEMYAGLIPPAGAPAAVTVAAQAAAPPTMKAPGTSSSSATATPQPKHTPAPSSASASSSSSASPPLAHASPSYSASAPPIGAPASAFQPLACCICAEEEPARGLVCTERHLTCAVCCPQYVLPYVERMKLVQFQGRVPCPWRTAGNQPCKSQPFTSEDIVRTGNAELIQAFLNGLKENALAAAVAPVAQQQQAAPPPVVPKPAAPVAPPALTAAEIAKLVRACLDELVPRCLALACPRCGEGWVDYNGCSALECARRTCGQHFCAVCLQPSASSQASHHHVNTLHGGHYHHDKFLQQHRASRQAKVVVLLLARPVAVRAGVLKESAALLNSYALDMAALKKILVDDARIEQPHTGVGAAQLANDVIYLPNGDPATRVLLWINRANTNRRLMAASEAHDKTTLHVAVPNGIAAVRWLRDHPRLLDAGEASRLRIISYHARSATETPAQLQATSAAAEVIHLLRERKSPVRLLIYCGHSVRFAEAYVRALQMPTVHVQIQEAAVLKYVKFQ